MEKWIWIPIYGAIRGFSEHSELCSLHSAAFERWQKDHDDTHSREMDRLMKLTWPAMDRALAGVWITVAELAIILIALRIIVGVL